MGRVRKFRWEKHSVEFLIQRNREYSKKAYAKKKLAKRSQQVFVDRDNENASSSSEVIGLPRYDPPPEFRDASYSNNISQAVQLSEPINQQICLVQNM